MNPPTEQEIIEAIKRSGYLMEQEVGTILESLGFTVKTNCAYEDVDENKSREFDVWAGKEIVRNEKSGVALFVEFICECKNNENPFIFLGRTKNRVDNNANPQEYVFPIAEYSEPVEGQANTVRLIPAFSHLGLAKHHYYYDQNKKYIQFCKLVREKKAWEAKHGGVYDEIFYPIVKAFIAKRKERLEFNKSRSVNKYIWLLFPIVVLKSDIYSIDSENPIKPEITPQISFTRELKSKTIEGRFVIDFVTQGYLKDFNNNKIMPFVQQVAKLVTDSPELFIKKNRSNM
jgi:hypothetical protein